MASTPDAPTPAPRDPAESAPTRDDWNPQPISAEHAATGAPPATTPGGMGAREVHRLVRRLLAGLKFWGLPLFFVLLLFLSAWEAMRDVKVIEPIEVPKQLVERGYSPTVVAQRLADEIHVVLETAKTAKRRFGLEAGFNKADFVLPGANVSLRSVVRYVLQMLGAVEVRIVGDVTQVPRANVPANCDLRGSAVAKQLSQDHQYLALVLRITGSGHVPPIYVCGPESQLEELLKMGGRELVKAVDPYLLASFWYEIEQKRREFDKTLSAIAHVLATAPDNDDKWAYNLWGIVLSDLKRPEESIQQFQRALELDAEFALAYSNWGNALRDLKKPEEAIDKYRRARKLDAKFAMAYNNWGNALRDLEKPEEAIDKYQRALKVNPKYVLAYSNWGNALRDLKNPKEAIEKYQRALALDPKYAPAYNNWGNALRDLEKPEEAIDKYQRALAADPKNAFAYNNWGNALRDLKNPKEAIEKYQRALALDPKYAPAYNSWGNALLDLDKPKEAIEKYQRALGLDRTHWRAYHNWAIALDRLGDMTEAAQKRLLAERLRGGSTP